MVNAGSKWLELPGMGRKFLESGPFLDFKNTVKYNRRFSVNPLAEARSRGGAVYVKIYGQNQSLACIPLLNASSRRL
jgi:hypothetical protein